MAFLGLLKEESGGSGVESGTRVVFNQTAAPTGWTKDTTFDNQTLRVVSGTASNGGAQSFTTVFGSGKSSSSHTLSTPQISSHTHGNVTGANVGTVPGFFASPGSQYSPYSYNRGSRGTPNFGGSQSHSHALSLDIQYVDVIIASKD